MSAIAVMSRVAKTRVIVVGPAVFSVSAMARWMAPAASVTGSWVVGSPDVTEMPCKPSDTFQDHEDPL